MTRFVRYIVLDKSHGKQENIAKKCSSDYSEAELLAADPRLVVLAPFTVSPKLEKNALKRKIAQWRIQIDACYPATEELNEAVNIIGLLLLHRFRDLNHQEIIDMLNLDLMQSRAVREIYQMGQIEGEQRGEQRGERLVITRLLEKRFGKLPHPLLMRLEQATLPELEHWTEELLTANCLDDIFKMQ